MIKQDQLQEGVSKGHFEIRKDGKDMDEMNIMNENDHTYEIENIDMKGTHIDKIKQMINFKRLMTSQTCLA